MTEIFNKKSNKEFRKKLRKQPIRSERILWNQIRNRRIGYKFRRQFGVGKYIVDFYCPKLRLVIEVDGATHSSKKEIEYDNKRQKYLESLELKVLRFRNIDIKENLDAVIDRILKVCEELNINNATSPCPSPS
jgi:very-short-patch-repair endonuclease